MAKIKPSYETNNQAITITLASLADGAYRESTAISNTTNRYSDYKIGGLITVGTSPTANQQIVIYLYESVDGGTYYSGGATGSDAAYTNTANQADNLIPAAVISTGNTSNHGYEFSIPSVRDILGHVPETFGIVVLNDTGVALNATGTNHDINFSAINEETV